MLARTASSGKPVLHKWGAQQLMGDEGSHQPKLGPASTAKDLSGQRNS